LILPGLPRGAQRIPLKRRVAVQNVQGVRGADITVQTKPQETRAGEGEEEQPLRAEEGGGAALSGVRTARGEDTYLPEEVLEPASIPAAAAGHFNATEGARGGEQVA